MEMAPPFGDRISLKENRMTAASDEIVFTKGTGIVRLLEIMARLRDPQTGCPWDVEQDFKSIAPYTIEEAYEVADAIERGSRDDLRDELGDLLLQVVYHAQMASEEDLFTFGDVAEGISEKMIRRQRAARVGFDWPEVGPVVDKIVEEAEELKEAIGSGDRADIAEEYGDLMFVMANLGRHLDLDAEEVLRGANSKFTRRFKGVEAELATIGKSPAESDLKEMDALWDKVKAGEREASGRGS